MVKEARRRLTADVTGAGGFGHIGPVTSGLRILCVGTTRYFSRQPVRPAATDGICFAEFEQVEIALIATSPGMVLSPLLSSGFDCVDLAQLLYEFSYQGRYRVVSDDLPQPHIVRDEVRALYPGLNFDIVRYPRSPDVRPN